MRRDRSDFDLKRPLLRLISDEQTLTPTGRRSTARGRSTPAHSAPRYDVPDSGLTMLLLGFPTGCLLDRAGYEQRVEELTDHDGDGFVQEDDCDDSDDAIFPGAPEVCDAEDQDCDGEVDEDAGDATFWYTDADADGYGDATDLGVRACDALAGTVANALDCDDAATQVNPAAEEVPYDGVDDDCDGHDLTDVDGDGFAAGQAGGDDCDDEDTGVNPAESEIPYDGVDQDCADGDAVDLDGDGSAALAAGGDDCDDTDAAIRSAAEETWANGFTDNDCDGEVETVVLDYGGDVWSGWAAGDNQGRRIEALGDLDGNGLQDVLVGSEYDSTIGANSGGVYAIDGAPGGSLSVARALLPDVAGQYFASDVDAGTDATGDGVPDVLVSTAGSDEVTGTAWLVDAAAWVAAGDSTIGDVVHASVQGSGPGTYGPSSVRFVGDVTGDGVPDIALSECCGTSSGASTLGRVAIFSVDDFGGAIEDADVLIDGPWEDAYMGGEMDPVGDQDGDGIDDIVVGGTGGLAAAVVAGTTSGRVDDLAITLIYAGTFTGYANARRAGDLDGDSREDVAILAGDDDGFIYFFTALGGSPTRVLQDPTSVFQWSDPGGVVDIVPIGDRDGDGRDELFLPQFYSDSGNQRAWILEGADVSYESTLDAESSRLSAVSVTTTAGFGYSAALAGDVDGDGQDDLVIGAPDYSGTASHAGGATIIPVPE